MKKILFFLIVVFLILSACSSPMTGAGNEAVISLRLGDGRYVFPNKVINSFEYEAHLSGPSGAQTHKIGKGVSTTRIAVVPGQWRITLKAYLGEVLCAEGSTSVNVIAGQSNPAVIEMEKDGSIIYLDDNFNDIVDFFNTAYGSYTLIVMKDVYFTEKLEIKSGVKLTVTSADTSIRSTIYRGTGTTTDLFEVQNGAELTIKHVIIDGQKDKFASNTGSLVYINGGRFTMLAGAVLQNNYASSGGGVYVLGGTFTMSGGIISGNSTSSTGTGGGVHVSAGGTFIMTSGEIKNANTANTGGGVYVNGTLTMSGGTISGNKAIGGGTAHDGGAGGGVSIGSGTFNMNSGTISANEANHGGGVYVNGTFNMNGGTISGNTATGSAGGGVYVGGGGKFYISNGIVYGTNESVQSLRNTAIDVGAALYLTDNSDGLGIAQYGSGGPPLPDIDTEPSDPSDPKGHYRENTIKVVGGSLQQ